MLLLALHEKVGCVHVLTGFSASLSTGPPKTGIYTSKYPTKVAKIQKTIFGIRGCIVDQEGRPS